MRSFPTATAANRAPVGQIGRPEAVRGKMLVGKPGIAHTFRAGRPVRGKYRLEQGHLVIFRDPSCLDDFYATCPVPQGILRSNKPGLPS